MEPKTLQDAIRYFATPKNCREYLVARRWPHGVTCPRCGSENVKWSDKYQRWQCGSHHERRQFTLKTGTIFEESPIGLDKWLTALWMLVNCKNGVSSWEIHRTIGVTQKTAWFMLHRLRSVLVDDFDGKMGGPGCEMEADETFVGGKLKNMHKGRRLAINIMRNDVEHWRDSTKYLNKTAVFGMLERETRQMRAQVVPNVRRNVLQAAILKNVGKGSRIYTDEHVGYQHVSKTGFVHAVVDHTKEYVRGRIHTNGMENFWSLLKRGLNGTYVSVEPFHLDRYLSEQIFRYNNRGNSEQKISDGERFSMAVRNVAGRRLMYKELTGKVGVSEAV